MSGHDISSLGDCRRCKLTPRTDISAEMARSYFCTASGRKLYLFDPCPEDIDVIDIATGLSGINRFGGHINGKACAWFYSVAEHSWLASYLVPVEHAMWALMHDAPEGLGFGDLISPAKRCLPEYSAGEAFMMSRVCLKLDIPFSEPATVKRADQRLLSAEQLLLQPNVLWLRNAISERGHEPLPADLTIRCWDGPTARFKFLERYEELRGKL